MRATLDGKPMTVGDGLTLAGLLETASAELAGSGRIVVEVRAGGGVLGGDELARALSSAEPLEDEVHLLSESARGVALAALEQVRQSLADAGPLAGQTADLLRADATARAMNALSELIELWSRVQQAVGEACALAGLDADAVRCDDLPGGRIIAGLADRLRELKSLITTRDTLALADALEYEWPDLARQWQRLIVAVGDGIESAPH